MSKSIQTQVSNAPQSSSTPAPSGLLQRKCTKCEEEEATLQRKPSNKSQATPPVLHEVLRLSLHQIDSLAKPKDRFEQEANAVGLNIAKNSNLNNKTETSTLTGDKLPLSVRSPVEKLLNQDFSSVKIFSDANAEAKVCRENAVAIAKDEEIYIAPWAYRPNHFLSRGLIAHELTHIAQQRKNRNIARDNFLVGSGHKQAIQRLEADLEVGKISSHWDKIKPKEENGLTPAPAGMTQRCFGCGSSCENQERSPSPEELKQADLKAKSKSLKTTIENPDKASFGELAAANAQLKDVEHDLALLERGFGTHVGNKASDLGKDKTPAPKKTDCTVYTIAVLRETFEAKGQSNTFEKILKSSIKASGGNLKGTELIKQLQAQAGWKALYWNPDTKFVDKKQDNSDDTEHTYSAHIARTKGYYERTSKVPIEKEKLVVNYSPRKETGTKRDETGLNKLKKIPFGVIAARGGTHMAMLISGIVYEVHWKEECTSDNVFDTTPLKDWAWLSGIVAAPASDIDSAWQ